MKAPIITIGNSKAVKLPDEVIKKFNFEDEVELVFSINEISLKRPDGVREGWDKLFKDEKINDEEIEEFNNMSNKFDDEEWEWK